MPNPPRNRGRDDSGFLPPSIWDVEEEDDGALGGQLDLGGPDEKRARASRGGVLRSLRLEGAGGIAAVPFPFEHLEAAARALARLDEGLADEGARGRWFAAMHRCEAVHQARLCGFPVDITDACLIEWDPLAPGQSRLNGLWVVGRGLTAARRVQRRARSTPPDVASLRELGREALGRWPLPVQRGAYEVCAIWKGLAASHRRGLLVFCEALGAVGSWRGLDVEERSVLLGVLSPWLARVFVPTRRCSAYLMREISWTPAKWERAARAGGDAWVALMLVGIGRCADRGHNVLRQLEVRHELALRASPARRKSHSFERGVDHLFQSPMVDVPSMMRGAGLSRPGAQKLIADLVAAGVLGASSRGRGRRFYAREIGEIAD